MSKRLLVITCHRLDENNGGANASKGFIHCLARLFDDCSIIFPEFSDTSTYIPRQYKLYPCHDSRSKLRKGFDMYRGIVGALYGCVREHLRHHSYDVIVIDHSASAVSLVKILRVACTQLITIHHNVERDYLRDNGSSRPITYRFPYNYYARQAERECLLYSDINLTVTQRDAEVFRSWYQNRLIHVFEWGIFLWRPLPPASASSLSRTPVPPHPRTFVITGSLDFPQSLQPIMEFVRKYWPLVRAACPEARLVIAGRHPHRRLTDECERAGDISIVPNPTYMAAVVREASYYVCPVNLGSGRKVRIMDGLRQGLPVLCHEVSSSGYECMAEAGCLFAYHDEQSFVEALERLLSAQVSPEKVVQIFRDNYSLETGVEKLRKMLEIND